MNSNFKLLSAGLLVAVLALAGCGGGSDTPTDMTVTPEPTAFETAQAAIAAATTPEAAQAAYNAVDLTAITGEEAAQLMAALQKRRDDLATMARIADQKKDLADAVAAVDTSDLTTREAITDARAEILALEMALAGATDLSDADKMGAESTLAAAKSDVSTATAELDLDDRKMDQRDDLSMKHTALQEALDGMSGIPTASEIAAAQAALNALNAAIEDAVDLDDAAKNAARLAVASAEGRIEAAQDARVAEDARKAAADKAAADKAAADKAEADKKEAAAMAATALKLYKGIAAQNGSQTDVAGGTPLSAGERAAAYNDANQPTSGTAADTRIMVGIGTTTVALSEDKKTMVADNHGWKGKRYTHTVPSTAPSGAGDMYEAIVYSNVEAPKPGDKFGQIGVDTPVDGYEYGLNADGQAAVNTSTEATYEARVGGASFDHDAGVKRFPLPSPNPSLATVVTIPGSFHGVSGTYSCTPGSAVCAANVTADGFELGTVVSATDATFTDGGGGWVFKPTNPEARVMESADTAYASYGWWLRKTADDKTYTASAFHDEKGGVDNSTGLDALNGTATYQGGAAGKYALSSSTATGGTNDAGHFTARATLEADFTNNTTTTAITGTIDNFIGADGESRNWSVALGGSAIGDTGVIGDSDNGTVWTIDGTKASASGAWSGQFRNDGTDDVPKVATGTFSSTYAEDGTMVGAFGANKQ